MTNNPMMSLSHSPSDSDSTAPFQRQPPSPPPPANPSSAATSSGKKPRGRPPGSKNKPKPKPNSVLVPEAAGVDQSFVIIDVPQGEDIMGYIVDLACRENLSVTVVNGSGNIASVTLRHATHGSAASTLHGPFSLVSFSGTFLYNNHYTLPAGATPPPCITFGISLCDSEGHVFGGAVGGKVVTGDIVSLTASTFRNPKIYKYDLEEDYNSDNDNSDNNLTEKVDKMTL
ncbi:AT-hook motif nuclear-localized protein 17 [Cajanus cajan]|uniref:DNA-binding protein ESCAROLA n=1 Tax=Cajanus cajan TaxID=3821 RepID=A0A151SAG6_CAJCA|nr:AT-hook motif nuclear-localized protein 17 [Cajanus cajan]KYP51729.1 Putative DNA-binding protein ESCAROLA [Cajanus cajan]